MILLMALMGALLFASCSDAEPNPRVGLNQDQQNSQSELQRSVVQITHEQKPLCTGVLISSTSLLTAGHCFEQKINFSRAEIHFWSANHPLQTRKIKSFQVFAHMENETIVDIDYAYGDIAIVHLEGNPFNGSMSVPILNDAEKALQRASAMLGIGVLFQKPHGDFENERLEQGFKKGFFSLEGYYPYGRFAKLIDARAYDEGFFPCHGDSGGPGFVFENGRWKLAGIVHGSFASMHTDLAAEAEPCSTGRVVYTSVSDYWPWIYENAAGMQDLPAWRLPTKPRAPARSLAEFCQSPMSSEERFELERVLASAWVRDCSDEKAPLAVEKLEIDQPLLRPELLKFFPNLKELKLRVGCDWGFEGLNHLKLKSLSLLNSCEAAFGQLDFTKIAASQLEKIHASGFEIFGLDQLEQVVELKIRNTHLYESEHLANLVQLVSLTAINAGLTVLPDFNHLNSLEKVILSNNAISDHGFALKAPNLQFLLLNRNPIAPHKQICPQFNLNGGELECLF